MKKVLLVVLGLLLTTSAQAKKEKLYLIDMTGDKFSSRTFNLYGDGLPADLDGFGIKLDGKIDTDFSVETKASNPSDTCSVKTVKRNSAQTILKIVESLEIDEGETCNITVTYSDGRSAVLSLYLEGT